MAGDPRRYVGRRGFVRLLGGAAGAGLLPWNFACGTAGGARVVNSHYRPTPEAPLTPTDDFYINYNFGLPELPEPSRWRLHLRGLVERETTLTFDDLMALPQATREVTLECIGNDPGGGLISSAAFTGVALREVMAEAGLDDRGRGIQFLGLDGYPSYLPVAVVEDDAAMIVHSMNGAPLTAVHGAPARVLFPGRYGMFSIKWLDSITVARNYADYGALSGLGGFIDGEKRVKSRVDAPGDGRTADVGEPIEVTGLAVTPGDGVARVEVAVDGEWQRAEMTFNRIGDDRSDYLWSLWRFSWTPTEPGRHVLSVRAFDARERTQSFDADFPYDASAIHSVRVLVRG